MTGPPDGRPTARRFGRGRGDRRRHRRTGDRARPGTGRALRPIVLEASSTVGGVLSAHRVGELTLDAGAESFATGRPAVTELIAELGLAERVSLPNPLGAWVRHRAGSAPLPATGFLGIPGRPWAADVRRVIGLPGVLRCAADVRAADPVRARQRDHPGRTGPVQDGPPGAGPARRAGGRRGLRDRPRHPRGADPWHQVCRRRWCKPVRWPVPPGCCAAAESEPGRRWRRSPAVCTPCWPRWSRPSGWRAARCGPAPGSPPWPAPARAGGSSSMRARRCRRAPSCWPSPPREAATLIGTADPGLSVQVLQAPITPVLICTLVLDDHRLDGAPRGTGVLVSAHASGVLAKALTHATAKWRWLADTAGPGRHVLRLSYGRGQGRASRPGGTARYRARRRRGTARVEPLARSRRRRRCGQLAVGVTRPAARTRRCGPCAAGAARSDRGEPWSARPSPGAGWPVWSAMPAGRPPR